MNLRFKYCLFFFYLFISLKTLSQKDSIKKNLSFDFGITRGQNVNLWPLFKKYKNQDKKEVQVLFPLFSSKRNYTEKTKQLRLLPFFISDSSYRGRDLRLLSLYYPSVLRLTNRIDSSGVSKSFKFIELAPHISLFSLSKSPGNFNIENNFLFFIWYRKDALQHKTKLIVFPSYWYFANKHDTTKALFPFFFKRNSTNQKYLNVALLYNQKSSLYQKKSSLFPLWWRKVSYTSKDTTKQNFVFPLVWTKQNKNVNNKIIFPLIFSFKDNEKKSFSVFPLFSYGKRYDSSFRYFAVTPLFWHVTQKKSNKNFLFPIYWNSEKYYKNDTVYRDVIFPFVWVYKSNSVTNKVVFPILYSYKNAYRNSLTVVPLFSIERDTLNKSGHTIISPFYWKVWDKGHENERVFLFFNTKKTFLQNDTIIRKTFFPLVWKVKRRDESSEVLFPFFWKFKSKTYSSFTFFPFYSKGVSSDSSKRHHLAITPFYWEFYNNRSTKKFLFPFFIGNDVYRNNDTLHRRAIFPVYWLTWNKSKRNTVYFPIVFSLNNVNRKSLTVFPLFSYGHNLKDSSRKYFAVTPFFWHRQTAKSKFNTLFPIYWQNINYNQNDTVKRHVVFPIFWSLKNKETNNKVLFPLAFRYNNQNRKTLTIFPLFSYGYQKKTGNSHLVISPFFWHIKNSLHKRDVLFPLYWQHKYYGINDTSVTRFFFPLYWHLKSKNESKSVFFPLVFRTKDNVKSNFTFFPLFSFGNKIDSSGHLVITPLFWNLHNKKSKSTVLFPLYFGKTKYLKDDTLRTNIVFPLLWSHRSRERQNTFVAPFVYKQKNTNYESFTFIPFFSFGKGVQSNKKHLMITPLFGRFSHSKSVNTFLFPLFSYRKDSLERHVSAMLFLFRHTKTKNQTKTSLLWPICAYEKKKEQKYFRIAPIVWFSKTDTSKMISIQPLFYSLKTNERKIFILSAFLYKRERIIGKSVSNSFLWRAFYSKKYTNGDFEKRFLHLIIANIKHEDKIEKAFLPFFHIIKTSKGDQSKSYFFGLYNRFKEFKPEINDFYEEERVFWFIRLRSNYQQLKSEGKGNFIRKRSAKK
ncbi:MAG: hypothetical protein SFY56_00540 [Bacteroidota bacterium]|nr:hypothetical protein [Bacteroidota bacterium]